MTTRETKIEIKSCEECWKEVLANLPFKVVEVEQYTYFTCDTCQRISASPAYMTDVDKRRVLWLIEQVNYLDPRNN